jgi:hypothetical protein
MSKASRFPNIEKPPLAPWYVGELEDHYAVELVIAFLAARGLNVKPHPYTGEQFVCWTRYWGARGIALYIVIGRDYLGLPFFHVTAALCHLARVVPEPLYYLLRQNNSLICPNRLGLMQGDLVSLEFCSHLSLLTPASLEFRLPAFLEMALRLREQVLAHDPVSFVAFPPSWFHSGAMYDE